jgi:hypothetical protein
MSDDGFEPSEDPSALGTATRVIEQVRDQVRDLGDHVAARVRPLIESSTDGDPQFAGPVVPTRPLYVRRIAPRAVATAAAFVAAIGVLALWIAAFVFWAVAALVGVVPAVERLLHDIGFTGFHFMSVPVIGAMLILSALGIASFAALAGLMAAAYNSYARTIAPIALEVDDHDDPVVPPSP